MRDKEADGVSEQHHQHACHPVPFAGDENGCKLQRLDHRQGPRQKEKRGVGAKALDLAPQALERPFGGSGKQLHQRRQRREFTNVRFRQFHRA